MEVLHEDIIGTGPYAEEVRNALSVGRTSDDIQTGTLAFAQRLEKETAAGRYIPGGIPVHAKYGMGLYTGRDTRIASNAIGRVVQKAFTQFYAKPEAMFGSTPAWRQLTAKYEARLVAMGYDSSGRTAWRAPAAQGEVSDMFFKIGAHTSGEFFVQNISPFFPAWREVTDTWLLKILARIGGGHRGIGGAYLLNRGRVLLDGMTHMGLIEEGPDGRRRMNIPLLSPAIGALYSAIAPGDQEYDFNFSFSSMFGLLPFPDIDAENWTEQLRVRCSPASAASTASAHRPWPTGSWTAPGPAGRRTLPTSWPSTASVTSAATGRRRGPASRSSPA